MSSCVSSVSAKEKNDEIKVKQNTFFELDIPSIPDKWKNGLELKKLKQKKTLT